MSCQNNIDNIDCERGCGTGAIIIIVLYILLAIIIGSAICC